MSAGGSVCSTDRNQQQQQQQANRLEQNEFQQQQSENRVAGGRQLSERESAPPLGLKYASNASSTIIIGSASGTESSKWLLGGRKGPENNKNSSNSNNNNNNIASKYNRSNSESAAVSATYPSLPVAASSHRKSFEMKSIWNYIRNQSSTNTVGSSSSSSPQKQQQQQQSLQSDNGNNNNNSNNNTATTHSSNTNISNFSRFSNLLLRGHYGGGSSTVQPYSSSTRGNSIPESVLLGLLPPIADLTQGGGGGGGGGGRGSVGGRGHNSRQRNSAPTIIQKDKTEKAWERMLKLKSNEKKEKRKTARLMLKSWVTPSSSGRQSAALAAAAAMANMAGAATEEPITTVVEHSVSHHGGRRLSQIDKYIRANVVVIIDKVSPTTNGHLEDHLSMLNSVGGGENQDGDRGCSGGGNGRTTGDLYDQSITSEDNFTSCRSCSAQVSVHFCVLFRSSSLKQIVGQNCKKTVSS